MSNDTPRTDAEWKLNKTEQAVLSKIAQMEQEDENARCRSKPEGIVERATRHARIIREIISIADAELATAQEQLEKARECIGVIERNVKAGAVTTMWIQDYIAKWRTALGRGSER